MKFFASFFGIVCVAMLVSSAVAANKPKKPAKPAKAQPGETRELLSDHQTIARLKDISFHRCMGLTSLCPDNCGDSGDYANFEIVAYLSYTKVGEYGDPKAQTFSFQIQDNHKKIKIPKELADVATALKPGDFVLLNWRHDYVTRTEEGGGVAKFPDRPVTKLVKITPEEAEKLTKPAPAK